MYGAAAPYKLPQHKRPFSPYAERSAMPSPLTQHPMPTPIRADPGPAVHHLVPANSPGPRLIPSKMRCSFYPVLLQIKHGLCTYYIHMCIFKADEPPPGLLRGPPSGQQKEALSLCRALASASQALIHSPPFCCIAHALAHPPGPRPIRRRHPWPSPSAVKPAPIRPFPFALNLPSAHLLVLSARTPCTAGH